MAGARRHLLRSMVVNADQLIPASFSIVSNRTFVLQDTEALFFQESGQFTELHFGSPAGSMTSVPRGPSSNNKDKAWEKKGKGLSDCHCGQSCRECMILLRGVLRR